MLEKKMLKKCYVIDIEYASIVMKHLILKKKEYFIGVGVKNEKN